MRKRFFNKYVTFLNFFTVYRESVLRGGLSKGFQPVFTRVSEKTTGNSKRLRRQAWPGFAPDNYRLSVLSVTAVPPVGRIKEGFYFMWLYSYLLLKYNFEFNVFVQFEAGNNQMNANILSCCSGKFNVTLNEIYCLSSTYFKYIFDKFSHTKFNNFKYSIAVYVKHLFFACIYMYIYITILSYC